MQSETASTPERRTGRDRRRRDGESHLVWVSVTGVVAIVMFFVLGIAGLLRFTDVVRDLNGLARAQDASRSETLRSACLQQNESTQRLRDTFANSVQVARQPGVPSSPRLEAFIKDYTGSVNMTLRFRDCSPSGIEAYFKNPPQPRTCRPDGKGFCLPDQGAP